jgi:hypothetical protein
MDAEHRASAKCRPRNPLLSDRGGACHLDAPLHVFPVCRLCKRLVIRREKNEMQLGVVGLGNERLDDPSQRHRLGLVVHRERMVCRNRGLDKHQQQDQASRHRRRFERARVHVSSNDV